jgi:hypothetical protein
MYVLVISWRFIKRSQVHFAYYGSLLQKVCLRRCHFSPHFAKTCRSVASRCVDTKKSLTTYKWAITTIPRACSASAWSLITPDLGHKPALPVVCWTARLKTTLFSCFQIYHASNIIIREAHVLTESRLNIAMLFSHLRSNSVVSCSYVTHWNCNITGSRCQLLFNQTHCSALCIPASSTIILHSIYFLLNVIHDFLKSTGWG